MNGFKRGMVSVIRRPGKAMILFFLVLILSMLMAGTISVRQGIINTERNLLARIPPVTTIMIDSFAVANYEETYGYWPKVEGVGVERLVSIGELPHVKMYDFAIYSEHFFSRTLSPPLDVRPYLNVWWDGWCEDDILDTMKMHTTLEIDGLEQMRIKGIRYPDILDVEIGLIELLQGRTFTETEVKNGENVALISRGFADENRLSLGSFFILEEKVHRIFDPSLSWEERFCDEQVLFSESVEFEVVGIFTPTIELNAYANPVDVLNHMDFNSRIYIPIETAFRPSYRLFDYLDQTKSPYRDYYGLIFTDIIFVVYDIHDLQEFNDLANGMLPKFTYMNDLTSEFSPMINAVGAMQRLTSILLMGILAASLAILGLLILFFLRDRRQEIGIYLALGERRWVIIGQILFEVVVVSFLAIVVSLFLGNIFASEISSAMLRNTLMYNESIIPEFTIGGDDDFSRMGLKIYMTAEEMLEAYSVTLDRSTVVSFCLASLGMILLATVFPIMYLIRFNPKKILL